MAAIVSTPCEVLAVSQRRFVTDTVYIIQPNGTTRTTSIRYKRNSDSSCRTAYTNFPFNNYTLSDIFQSWNGHDYEVVLVWLVYAAVCGEHDEHERDKRLGSSSYDVDCVTDRKIEHNLTEYHMFTVLCMFCQLFSLFDLKMEPHILISE